MTQYPRNDDLGSELGLMAAVVVLQLVSNFRGELQFDPTDDACPRLGHPPILTTPT